MHHEKSRMNAQDRLAALRNAFDDLDADPGCRVGLCARGLEGPFAGRAVGVGENRVFPSASLIKVLVLAELLRQVDAGKISLKQTVLVRDEDLVEDSDFVRREGAPGLLPVGELAEGMISESDNAATNCLISLVGQDSVNALARNLELKHTFLGRKMMDFEARSRGEDNLTSASDMVGLLAELWGGRLLSPGSRELALGFLGRQKLSSALPISLPPGARFAHKTGELEGIEHDAGIVFLPGRSFALALLTQGETRPLAPRIERAVRSTSGLFYGSAGENA